MVAQYIATHPFLTFACSCRGGWDHGCLIYGGNRRVYILSFCGRRVGGGGWYG